MKSSYRVLTVMLLLWLCHPATSHAFLRARAAHPATPRTNVSCDNNLEVSNGDSEHTQSRHENASDCPSYQATDYSTRSEARATYGSVHASASAMMIEGIGFDPRCTAGASAEFKETITIDGGARNGTTGTLQFTAHASGTLGISTDDMPEATTLLATGHFKVLFNQTGGNVVLVDEFWTTSNDASFNENINMDTSHDPVEFVFGEPFTLDTTIGCGVTIMSGDVRDETIVVSGSGSANFGSTGRITGIAVYDAAGGPLGDADYNLISASGYFDVPSTVSSSSSSWGSLKARYR